MPNNIAQYKNYVNTRLKNLNYKAFIKILKNTLLAYLLDN